MSEGIPIRESEGPGGKLVEKALVVTVTLGVNGTMWMRLTDPYTQKSAQWSIIPPDTSILELMGLKP